MLKKCSRNIKVLVALVLFRKSLVENLKDIIALVLLLKKSSIKKDNKKSSREKKSSRINKSEQLWCFC